MVDKWQPVTVKNATVESANGWDPQVVQLAVSAGVILLAYLLHRWVSMQSVVTRTRLPKQDMLLTVPVTDDTKMKLKMFKAHGKELLSCTQCTSFTIKDPVDRVDASRRGSNKTTS
jgi:hypothetical protein